MSFRIIARSLKTQSEGLRFQCDHGGKNIECGIAADALRDLVDFHLVKSDEDEAFRALLLELERLANAKYDAGRFEENGWLVIWPADLLRYGFQGQAKSVA